MKFSGIKKDIMPFWAHEMNIFFSKMFIDVVRDKNSDIHKPLWFLLFLYTTLEDSRPK